MGDGDEASRIQGEVLRGDVEASEYFGLAIF